MRRTITATITLLFLFALPHGAAAGADQKKSRKKTDAASAAAASKQGPAFSTDPALMDGFRALYEQDFISARAKFIAWSAGHPDEAFGQVSLAAGYLFDEFNRHGVLTSEFFMNDDKFLHGINFYVKGVQGKLPSAQ